MKAYKYLFLCSILVITVSLTFIVYISTYLIEDARQEIIFLHRNCVSCTEKYNLQKNNKHPYGTIPQYVLSPCMQEDSPYYNNDIAKLEIKIERYAKVRVLFRILFVASCAISLILLLILLIRKRRYIFEAVTKSKTQRIGIIALAISLTSMYFEATISDDYNSFPIFSSILLLISLGMISTLFQRLYFWIQKGQ